MVNYPLIVVPEWEYLEPSFKDELVAYVKGGGNLLLIGAKTVALFQAELVRSDDATLLQQDCFCAFIAPRDGRYIVQIRDVAFGGSAASGSGLALRLRPMRFRMPARAGWSLSASHPLRWDSPPPIYAK